MKIMFVHCALFNAKLALDDILINVISALLDTFFMLSHANRIAKMECIKITDHRLA